MARLSPGVSLITGGRIARKTEALLSIRIYVGAAIKVIPWRAHVMLLAVEVERSEELRRDLVRERASEVPLSLARSATAPNQRNREIKGRASYLGVEIRKRQGDLELDFVVILAVLLVATAVLVALAVFRIVAAVLLCNTRIVRWLSATQEQRFTSDSLSLSLPHPHSLSPSLFLSL